MSRVDNLIWSVQKRLADLLSALDDVYMDMKHMEYVMRPYRITLDSVFVKLNDAMNSIKEVYDQLNEIREKHGW